MSIEIFTLKFTLRRGVLDTTLCGKVCQWFAAGRRFYLGIPVSSTNKTDSHDITERLNTIALTLTLKLVAQYTCPFIKLLKLFYAIKYFFNQSYQYMSKKSIRIENEYSQFREMTTAILKYANGKWKGHLPECQNCTKN